MKKIATMAFLCTVAATPVMAQDKTVIEGYYCEAAAYEIVDVSGTCEEPAYKDETTGQCISSFIGTDYLKIAKTEDGNIDFSLFLVYTSGASCGLEGTAAMIDEGTWLYETNLIEGDSSPSANCSVKISYSENGVTVSSPNQNATCQDMCGMGGNLIHVEFPMATKDVFNENAESKCSRAALSLKDPHLMKK